MQALSMDLRARIVAAYVNGEGSQEAIGNRFSVSRTVVGKLVHQQREQGTLYPQLHRCGRKPAVAGEKLHHHLVDYPDATLVERIEALDLDCCVNTTWMTLRRLGYRYKKVVASC